MNTFRRAVLGANRASSLWRRHQYIRRSPHPAPFSAFRSLHSHPTVRQTLSPETAKTVEVPTFLSKGRNTSETPLHTVCDVQNDITINVFPSSLSLCAPSYGLEHPFHFDHVWLRDICTEPSSVESATQQKLFHTSDIHIPTDKDSHGLFTACVSSTQIRTHRLILQSYSENSRCVS